MIDLLLARLFGWDRSFVCGTTKDIRANTLIGKGEWPICRTCVFLWYENPNAGSWEAIKALRAEKGGHRHT